MIIFYSWKDLRFIFSRDYIENAALRYYAGLYNAYFFRMNIDRNYFT